MLFPIHSSVIAHLCLVGSFTIMLTAFLLTYLLASASANSRWEIVADRAQETTLPPPPPPEPIEITKVPLPPVTSSNATGSCSYDVNPHGTGCVGQVNGLQGGSFLSDSRHVLATVLFTGAPESPDPRSIYTGQQLIVVKTDDTLFPNGDSWKCLTCGVPANQSIGYTTSDFAYPQAFADGSRALCGNLIVSCGNHSFVSDTCNANTTFIYTVRLSNTADDSGPGASLRETRLHPDNVHIGVNSFDFSSGSLGQDSYLARLTFNAAPSTGTPLGPRYDLTHVNKLTNPNASTPFSVKGSEIVLNSSAIQVGELRGFSGTGNEVTYIGYSTESCNIDVYAANLYTGAVRRLTSHPGYVDPVHISPDDGSIIILDTRGNNRTNFLAALRHIPPIVDIASTTICASERNNGQRRFFQPWLLGRYGDRDNYYGQEINGASKGDQGTGGLDDPEWNAGADPWFSPDGTKIVYWQTQTVSPACGGANPLPCYESKEPGGAQSRLLIAHLTSRKPLPTKSPKTLPDVVPWAAAYVPGTTYSAKPIPHGNFTLKGKYAGHAAAAITPNDAGTAVGKVVVVYHNFSDDGLGAFSGYQNITSTTTDLTVAHLDWYSTLTYTGKYGNGTQMSSPDGFHVSIDVLVNLFEANGTLVTVVNGTEYTQPGNGD